MDETPAIAAAEPKPQRSELNETMRFLVKLALAVLI